MIIYTKRKARREKKKIRNRKVYKKSLFCERNHKTMTFYIKENILKTGCFCFSLADRLLLCYTKKNVI